MNQQDQYWVEVRVTIKSGYSYSCGRTIAESTEVRGTGGVLPRDAAQGLPALEWRVEHMVHDARNQALSDARNVDAMERNEAAGEGGNSHVPDADPYPHYYREPEHNKISPIRIVRYDNADAHCYECNGDNGRVHTEFLSELEAADDYGAVRIPTDVARAEIAEYERVRGT